MENISQMSLLEVAIYLMEQKKTRQSIRALIKEVLEMKGLDDEDGSLATQLYIDITTSSKFVYMGDEEWDLKIRQSLEEYDKDGSAFNVKGEDLDDEDDLNEDLNEEDEYEEDEDEEESEDDEDDFDDEESEDSYDDYDEEADEDDLDEDAIIDGEETERYSEDDDFDEDKYNDLMDDYEDIYE